MKATAPFLIAGVPIAGLALQSWSVANAWSTPPPGRGSSCHPAASRIRRGGGGTSRHRGRGGMTTTRSSSPSHSAYATMSDGGIFDVGDLESLHLTPQLKMMTMAFASIPDERTRHKQLLYMASKLPNVDDDVRVSENKVPGCLSQVYVDCTATRTRRGGDDDDANVNGENDATMDGGNDDVWVVEYRGDSDGLLTKGLLALLVRGLNGCTPDEIDAIDPKFVTAARISQTLTPGRNNGFLNMLAVMKRKAREAVDRANVEGGGGSVDGDERASDSSTTATASNAMTTSGGPMYNAILAILSTSLKPKSIVLVDESHKHAGHAGSKGFEGGESHFSLNIVSDAFEGLNLVKRHKLIYVLLGDVMPRIHALAIVARSTSEVE